MYDPEPEPLTADKAQKAMDALQSAFGIFMNRVAEYILEHEDDVRAGGFALSEVLDRFGMQLMSFGTLFANFRSFADGAPGPAEPIEGEEEEEEGR